MLPHVFNNLPADKREAALSLLLKYSPHELVVRLMQTSHMLNEMLEMSRQQENMIKTLSSHVAELETQAIIAQAGK